MINQIKIYGKKIIASLGKYIVLKNVNNSQHDKACLLAYITKPFVKGTKPRHPNYFEARSIAAVLNELEYNVDVAFFDNEKFNKYDKYDLIIGLGECFDNSTVNCKSDVVRIYYATGANFIESFYNEIERWIALYDRRGIVNSLSRFGMPKDPKLRIQSMKDVDGIITVGGSWCASTYNMWGKRVYKVGVIPFTHYSYMDMDRTISECRRNFLWMGGKGLIHKGLDIVLETFAKFPNYNLYIACNYEKGFWDKYESEMNKENIHYVGFVNTNSAKFRELCSKCAYTIVVSCSEGTCTSIVTGMYTGLIPITTKEAGIDYGYILDDYAGDYIIKMIAELDKATDEEIQENMEQSYKYVVENYTADAFEKKFKDAMITILEDYNNVVRYKGNNYFSNV